MTPKEYALKRAYVGLKEAFGLAKPQTHSAVWGVRNDEGCALVKCERCRKALLAELGPRAQWPHF